ncbi:MAG: beta-ketoacyl synthase N-terminal-like domain-containing protein, partial [Candidatus Sumerlaeota bacterium]
MECFVTGGGWILSSGWGNLSAYAPAPEPGAGSPHLPKGKEIFTQPLPRYGRFDFYTRLGLGAMGLALQDAGYELRSDKSEPPHPCGIVSQSQSECIQTDKDYYVTTLEGDGAYSSPNLFSYTLPGIVQGECAVHFGLGGPTLCLGCDGNPETLGLQSISEALRLIRAGKAEAMLAGWIEAPVEHAPHPQGPLGSAFIVLAQDGGGPSLQLKQTARCCCKTNLCIQSWIVC